MDYLQGRYPPWLYDDYLAFNKTMCYYYLPSTGHREVPLSSIEWIHLGDSNLLYEVVPLEVLLVQAGSEGRLVYHTLETFVLHYACRKSQFQ